jgi:nucleoside-diphosphate kinase
MMAATLSMEVVMEKTMEKTLILLKPNTLQRRLCGEIISRLERKGLKLVAVKLLSVDRSLASRHYQEHEGKPFYEELLAMITAAPVLALVAEGEQAVAVVRALCGATDPGQALPGTIRGDYGMSITQNIIHASDSPASAEREIDLFFTDREIIAYPSALDPWI